MAFKLIIIASLVAVAFAGVTTTTESYEAQESAVQTKIISPSAKVATSPKKLAPIIVKSANENYDANPKYSYSYDVKDGLTGDNKQHQETRNGDVVEGSYSLVEADGSRRVVHYNADPVHGFNAVVDKQAPVIHNQKPVAKLVSTQTPTYHRVVQPAEQIIYGHHSSAVVHPQQLGLYQQYPAPAYNAYPVQNVQQKVHQPIAPAVVTAHLQVAHNEADVYNPAYTQNVQPVDYGFYNGLSANKVATYQHPYGLYPQVTRTISPAAYNAYPYGHYAQPVHQQVASYYH